MYRQNSLTASSFGELSTGGTPIPSLDSVEYDIVTPPSSPFPGVHKGDAILRYNNRRHDQVLIHDPEGMYPGANMSTHPHSILRQSQQPTDVPVGMTPIVQPLTRSIAPVRGLYSVPQRQVCLCLLQQIKIVVLIDIPQLIFNFDHIKIGSKYRHYSGTYDYRKMELDGLPNVEPVKEM